MANTDTSYQPLFIVDGYPCKGINGLTQQRFSSSEEALNLFLEFYPFLVKNDIDSINIIREEDFGKHNMYPRKPIDTIIISTKKASQIKLFFLNGNLNKRHRGIELGALLTDREVLQKRIQKQWGINPDRITDIVVQGKVILITTDK